LREQIEETFWVPRPLPKLDAVLRSRFNPAPGVVGERVLYATQFGMRIPAILYWPDPMPAGRLPGLIVVNGHGGDKYSWYSTYAGILYARGGAVVLTYDPVGEGERNKDRRSGARAHDVYVPPPEMARRLAGLMMTDVMQGVSYLAERKEVDPKRLAALGYSMGSFVLALTCAVETRLHACALVGGGNLDGPGGYWDSSDKKMCQALPYQALSFLGDRPAVVYALHASRGPTLVFNGGKDSVVAIPEHPEAFFADLRRRVVAERGRDENVFDFGFDPLASHRPFFLTRPVASWLHRHLRFPLWTDEGIRRLGETHISEWARANNLALESLYSNEQREGGTMALGTDIPALSRNVLDVFTEAEWLGERDRLIYEAWVRQAKGRVSAP